MPRSLYVLVASLLFWSTASLAGKFTWEEIDKGEGISVYRTVGQNSGIYGFRGETIISDSIGRIYDVLADRKRRKEWVDRLQSNSELEVVSPEERIIYQVFGLPWPISDRDYVYRAKSTRDSSNRVTVTLNSVTHPKAPPSVGVRAHLHLSKYVLTPLGQGKTKVEVEIHTDPKGSLPAWLVNLIQKSWPRKTLNGIKGQLKKPFVKNRPLPAVSS